MTATWVLVPDDDAAVPPGWEQVDGLRAGWSGAVVMVPADVPDHPALVSYVEDSGFCVLEAVGHWRWVLNDEPFIAEADPGTLAEYGLPATLTGDDDVDDAARAERRRRVVPLMVSWAAAMGLPAPDPVRLDEVLDRRYLPAETGFFALLDALAIRPAPARTEVVEVLPPLPDPARETVDHWVIDRSGPRFAFQVDTYVDLFTRLDLVAGWLTRLREMFPDARTVSTVSMKDRYRDRDCDDRTWQRVLREVEKGQFRQVGVSFPGGRFEVELRSPLVDEPAGPLPNGYPAYFLVQVDRPAPGQPEPLAELLRTTAATFDAVSGFLTADIAGFLGTYAVRDSPYESRSGAFTYPHRRLDEITRGVHWGNVWTARHLDTVGGVQVLRESGEFHRVEPIADSDLWWLQLTEDPDDLDHAHVDRAAWLTRAVMPRLRNGNIGLTDRV